MPVSAVLICLRLMIRTLPAYDTRAYYDPDYEDQDDVTVRHQGCSNRGRKHLLASRSARIGRMPGWSDVMPTTFDETERATKRQKRNTVHPQMAFAPGSFAGPASSAEDGLEESEGAAVAKLDPPPGNPVDVLTRLGGIRTFSTQTHSSVFNRLALNATNLLETDSPCVKALARSCAILRGDDMSWLPPEEATRLPVQKSATENAHDAASKQKEQEQKQAEKNGETAPEASSSNANQGGDTSMSTAPEPSSSSTAKQEDQDQDQEQGDVPVPASNNPADDLSALQADSAAPAPHEPQAGPSEQPANGESNTRKRAREASPSAFELSVKLKQLIDPASAVEHLFVSPTPVAVPSSGSTAIVSLQEQKLLLHAGLIELSRFLADCLEYQERLREVSDQILGVDRRRKGLYTILKRFVCPLLFS